MSTIVVLGAGFAGQTAALYLRKGLSKSDRVIVVNPRENFVYVPSLVWVGVGSMEVEQPQFPLDAVYKRKGIEFDEIDITNNQEAVDLIVAKRGKRVIPTLEYNGKFMDGNRFDPEKFEKELAELLA